MPTATVVQVSEHIAGTELTEAPYVGALWPSASLWPSQALWPSAATQLSLIDPDELDQDGGQVLLTDVNGNTEIASYVFPDEGQDVIDLTTAITGTYTTGDLVQQWTTNGLIPERWVDAMEPQASETIRCRVPHTLYDKLAMGIRNDDNAEQITFAQDGTDLVVTDVLGKSPVQDLNSVLITTDPRQSGERVDIQADGIREIEADGTTVAVSLTQAEGLDLLADSALGVNPTRIIRWLLSDLTEIGNVASWEDGIQDALSIGATARTSGRYGQSNVIGSGLNQVAHVQVRGRDSDDSAEVVLVATSASSTALKFLLRNVSGVITSDFLFADGSNLPTGLLGTTAWADWTPTLTGWSANPAGGVYRYKQIGKLVHVQINQPTAGTSNNAAKSITAPVTAATISGARWEGFASAVDNGSALATSARARILSGGTVINFDKTLAAADGWTASGSHQIVACSLVYEAA